MLSLKPPTSPEIGTPQSALPSQSEITQEITPKQNLPGLVAMIREHFERAKSVKAQFVNDRLLSCVYAFKSEYEPKKLTAIRELGGSEAYIPLTNMKVRAGKAWLSDIFFSPNSKIFELKTTPVPTPPPDIAKRIQGELSQEIDRLMEAASRLAVMSKGMFDMSSIQDVIESRKAAIREKYIKKVRERAKRLIEVEEQRIHDQFVEGGFYKALAELLNDIMTYPTAILKGPVLRKKRKFITNSREIVDVVVPTYNRVSPFDAFPAPYASNFEDGYFIEILHLRPQDLRSLVGMEGYYSDAILEVLEQYNEGGLTEWTGLVHERNYIEDKTEIYDDTIDVIEYWGAVRGALLEEWDIEVEDRSEYYDIVAWVVDNKIIKAILNPDPLGTKPYNKASFVEIPDSFWGMSLPEILSPIQNSVNALARAAINNAVLSSGALIERNIDRIGSKAKKEIIPFQIFDVRESALNSAPAYRFYQLTPTADRLVVVMSMFQKMADEYSGIPAYAHGDVTVGGAGRALADYEKVLTDRGYKEIKDIQVGDKVAGTDGGFHDVLGVYPQEGLRPMFRVKFSNGAVVDCDADHLWTVSDHPSEDRRWKTISLKEIMARGIYRTANGDKSKGYRPKWAVPKLAPIEFEKKEVDLDPYTLGVILGDGDSRGRVHLNAEDSEHILGHIPYNKGAASFNEKGTAVSYTLLGVRSKLAELGLGSTTAKDKYIPKEYLYNSKEVRLELLRGLMDTDGCATEGRVFFCSSSITLIKQVRFIVQSLGGWVGSIIEYEEGEGEINGRTVHRGKNYRTYFSLNENVFKLPRKRNAVVGGKRESWFVYITEVEPIGEGYATCIKVSSEDSLFLCSNLIPTHNTASGLSMLQNQASRGIKDVVKNIDEGIIEPLVSKQYYFNLYSRITDPSQIPDLTIQAKGSEGLREKEAQSARMLEYLQITSNPVDMQLMGMEGRKYLLEGIAKNAGLDSEKLFPQDEAQAQELTALLQGLNPVTGEGGQIRQISPNNTAGVPQKAAELGLDINQFKKENGR